jgi:hypothetical protein
MRNKLVILALLTVFVFGIAISGIFAQDDLGRGAMSKDNQGGADSLESDAEAVGEGSDSIGTGRLIVYYFHGTRRCRSCKTIEDYSHEAVNGAFAEKLADSTMEWRLVNVDEAENRHYINDYKLYTKSLVLSYIEEGVETRWKNLDRVWKLLGDKEAFIEYVQTETRRFIEEE